MLARLFTHCWDSFFYLGHLASTVASQKHFNGREFFQTVQVAYCRDT